jgi:hypothetical protein
MSPPRSDAEGAPHILNSLAENPAENPAENLAGNTPQKSGQKIWLKL